MNRKKRSLDDDVSAAFERACRERDFAVAEHLLRALEAIADRNGDDAPLQRAYLEFARSLPEQRS